MICLASGCVSLDAAPGTGTVPPASAGHVAGLRFVCVGSWPDDHYLKHSFMELPDYSNEPAAISRLCAMIGTRASAFAGDGFMRLYVSGRDVDRLAALTYRPEKYVHVTACRGSKQSRGASSNSRRLWFFPMKDPVRLTQIPKELCDSIQVGSFIETDPLASSWELNLYGTEADKIALCQLASELVDTSQCQVAKEDDDSE